VTTNELTCDSILDGRIRLMQPQRGHRAGSDAILLAAAAPAQCEGLVLDIGAGVGTVGLILAGRSPAATVGLVEQEPGTAALARENVKLNDLFTRVGVHEADLFAAPSRKAAGLLPGKAALVVTNPPFGDPSRSRVSPDVLKRAAHVMQPDEGHGLAEWIRASLALLAPSGTFILIHRADALAEILAACGQRIGGLTLLPVHPQAGKPAHRLLLRGKKGSRAPLTIAPPLILQEDGHFTPQAEAIHRGQALIEW